MRLMSSRPYGPARPDSSAPEPPTRAELLAAQSVAIDLGLGQPAEHMLRAALIATRLADRLGLEQRAAGLRLLHDVDHVDRLSRRLARVRAVVRRRHRRAPRLVLGRLVRAAVHALPGGQRRSRSAARAPAERDGNAVGQRARPHLPADPLALHVRGPAGRSDRPGPQRAGGSRVHVRALRRRRTARRRPRRRDPDSDANRGGRRHGGGASPHVRCWRAPWPWPATGGAGSSTPRSSTRC